MHLHSNFGRVASEAVEKLSQFSRQSHTEETHLLMYFWTHRNASRSAIVGLGEERDGTGGSTHGLGAQDSQHQRL